MDQEAADELVGVEHDQTNALGLTEMDPAAERAAIRATIDRIEAASGTRPLGWLGAGLRETWNTLDYLREAGIRYVCDWVNDDQPYQFEIGTPPLLSLPYSVSASSTRCTAKAKQCRASWRSRFTRSSRASRIAS